MNLPDDLPESVRQLARPRLALRTERLSPADLVVGVWGGSGLVPLPAGSIRSPRPPTHRIGVDCPWLAANGFGVRGCLSVYAAALEVAAVNDPHRTFADAPTDGAPLFGREEASWPEEEALAAYLTADELRAFAASGLDEYLGFARQANPLYDGGGGVAAVLGGWHTNWPDGPPQLPRLEELNERIDRAGGPGLMPAGSTYRCEPYRLLLWTLRDAEPWFEVWGDGAAELHAIGRVT